MTEAERRAIYANIDKRRIRELEAENARLKVENERLRNALKERRLNERDF